VRTFGNILQLNLQQIDLSDGATSEYIPDAINGYTHGADAEDVLTSCASNVSINKADRASNVLFQANLFLISLNISNFNDAEFVDASSLFQRSTSPMLRLLMLCPIVTYR